MNDWLQHWAGLDSPEARAAFCESGALPDGALPMIHAAILESLHHDFARSTRLNEFLRELAERRGDPLSSGWANRSQGHIEHTAGRYENAIGAYSRAAEAFQQMAA